MFKNKKPLEQFKITPDEETIINKFEELGLKDNYDIDNCEYYFLIDRSGSMYGSTIRLAVEALKLFLYSLPSGCKFNIVSFGSDFEFMFNQGVEYNDENLNKAVNLICKFDANMGGTEILQPI